MSSRKLTVIEYPKLQVDPDDVEDVRFLICFVEERWLKRKEEDWLVAIMDEKRNEKVQEMMEEYLVSNGFKRGENDTKRVIVDRMINAAIDQKYKDTGTQLTANQYQELKMEKEEKERGGQNPFNHIQYTSNDVVSSIRSLCSLLGLANHPDPQLSLRAACLYITQNLSVPALEARNAEKDLPRMELKSFPLGLAENKDGAVNVAARIIRMLSLENLKERQKTVNDALVHIQDIIADLSKHKR